MRRNLILVLVLVLPASLRGQSSSNLNLVSQLSYPVGTCADVWAEGDYVYLARRGEGIEIVDVSDPTQPVSVFSGYGNLFVQDIKVQGNLLAFSNESGNGQGLYLLDVSNPAQPVFLSSFGSFNLLTCHNLVIHGTLVYCCSLIGNNITIVDVSTPQAPLEVGVIQPQAPISQIHDVAIVDGKLYSSWLSGGFEIHDLTGNPAQPTLLLHHQTPTSFLHNTWPLPGGTHVVTTQEASGGYLEVWDVSNPAAVTMVGQWRASPVAVMHNVLVQEHFAFITNYTEGVRVVDLRTPSYPVEVAHYDTFAGVNPFTFGAWGVYPLGREHVYVADFNSGLYVLDFKPLTVSIATDQPSYVEGETITLALGLANVSGRDQQMNYDLFLNVLEVGPQLFPLLSIPGIVPSGLNVTVPLPLALPTGLPALTLTFTATVSSPADLLLYDAASVTVPVL